MFSCMISGNTHTNINIYAYMYTHVYVYVYALLKKCTYTYMHGSDNAYTYIYIHVYMHICVYMYTYMYFQYFSPVSGVTLHTVVSITISTGNVTPSKSTKSRNLDFSVSRGTNSKWAFGLTWICTEEFGFLDLVYFGDVAF